MVRERSCSKMSWQEYDYEEYHRSRPVIRFGPKLTPTIKALIIVNVVVFVLEVILGRTSVLYYLSVVPYLLIHKLFLWQLFTYMFLHGSPWHLLFNMLVLWMLGSDVEARLGKRQFLQLYFLSGVGAGLCHAAVSWGSTVPMLGASGAVFGVLIAFAMLFPERYITLFVYFFPLTVKAKHLAMGFAALEILWVVSAARDGVAHFAHLGGFVFGYVYMKWRYRLSLPFAFAERFADSMKRRWYWGKRPEHRYTPIDADEFISEEVDPILAKISRHGIGSLTRREKRILKKARSQMK
jgi:membrane associated rhomboid family serine protease